MYAGRRQVDPMHDVSPFAVYDDEAISALLAWGEQDLQAAAASWPAGAPIRIFDELVAVYGRATLDWAGTGVHGDEAGEVSTDLALTVTDCREDRVAQQRSGRAMARLEKRAVGLVRAARTSSPTSAASSAVERVATIRDRQGSLLPEPVAVAALLDVLRLPVSVAYLGALATLALSESPGWRRTLAAPEAEEARRAFVEEVRRAVRFGPAVTWPMRDTAVRCTRGERLALRLLEMTVRYLARLDWAGTPGARSAAAPRVGDDRSNGRDQRRGDAHRDRGRDREQADDVPGQQDQHDADPHQK